MEGVKKKNSSRFGTNLSEEDAALSAFRRRNKIVILVLLFLIVAVAVALAVLIAYFGRNFYQEPSEESIVNSAVKAYCRVTFDYPWCLGIFARKFRPKSRVSPSQIFTYSLQTASEKLESFVSFLSTDLNRADLDFVHSCSNSSIGAMKEIGNTLARMHTNPFVETQSDDERTEMANWMSAAAENLDSCLGEVQRAELTEAAVKARAAVREVQDYVDAGAQFLNRYGYVVQILESNIVTDRGMKIETLFGIAMVSLQLLYMFFLFWCLFRIR